MRLIAINFCTALIIINIFVEAQMCMNFHVYQMLCALCRIMASHDHIKRSYLFTRFGLKCSIHIDLKKK